MTTVFLSGSRKLNRINDAIRKRIDNMQSNGISIIVGDANGADKAMQSYLADIAYPDVTVFCAGDHCRNNIGKWQVRNVAVNNKLSGRDFYAQKDKEMAKMADCGLVLWDGKSAGSVENILELVKLSKIVVVYYGPGKTFYNVGSDKDLIALLNRCDPEDIDAINKKIRLTGSLRELREGKQTTMAFQQLG